jgi:hypothetical protein
VGRGVHYGSATDAAPRYRGGHACLDALDKRPRTVSATGEVPWLQPYPDELLDELAGDDGSKPTRRGLRRAFSYSADPEPDQPVGQVIVAVAGWTWTRAKHALGYRTREGGYLAGMLREAAA